MLGEGIWAFMILFSTFFCFLDLSENEEKREKGAK
jgi:hypothetical protein